jgi:hypothetical protein
MSFNRLYKTWDMGKVVDNVGTYDATFYYTYSGTLPSWFNREPYVPGDPITAEHYPTYSYLPPQGTAGFFTFTVNKHQTSTGTVVDTGIIEITIEAFTQPVWKIDHCNKVNIKWLHYGGGWQSYIFDSITQVVQDKGSASTYINSDNETRFHRKDDIYQGVIVSTENITPDHSEFISDAFKSIQAYLDGGGLVSPIIINPETFKKVSSVDSFSRYTFEFRHAIEDVIQSQ